MTSGGQQRPFAGSAQRQPTVRSAVSLRAPTLVEPATAVEKDRLLDRPLFDRPRRSEARPAAPKVKTLDELRRVSPLCPILLSQS